MTSCHSGKGLLYDTDLLHLNMPSSMSMFLNYWEDNYAFRIKAAPGNNR